MVQYLVLAHAQQHVELTRNSGNLALLKSAAELGLIAADLADHIRDAYRQYRRWQHALRLQGAQYARLAPEEATPFSAPVCQLWEALFTPA
jgi:glutamate-ammonia-ligase adenylyltransferase